METTKNKLSFVIDIDGVIIKSKHVIPRAKEGIELLQKHNIPYIFLTNNISKSQEFKANQLTNLMTLETPINKNQVILNYTPLKRLFGNWKEKLVLIIGRNQIDGMLPFEEIPYYITIVEYVHIFPQSTPLTQRDIKDSQEIKQRVSKRLNIKDFNILDLKFDVVLVLNVPTRWEDSIQIIVDVMSTADGRVTKQPEYKYQAEHIPIYTALYDSYFRRETHPLPRFLMKPFCLALKAVYKEVYGNQLKITHFGKPNYESFEFAHRHIDSIYGTSKEYVMIGDTIQTDIDGAYNYGWKSILVQSGVSLHQSEKANHHCLNLEQAVKWALKQNGYE